MFKSARGVNAWNSRWEGKLALETLSHGYKHGGILGKMYLSHRVIWAMTYSTWPKDQIDHINGVKTDNRIINLRVVNNQDNQKNISIPITNSSGTVGVSFDRKSSKWSAYIQVDGRTRHLGHYADINDAIEARAIANNKYNFHKGHGKPTNKEK